ncbi:HPP family protein [Holophaga foetida]|uniref:HPP family protein n=1 Tax=Holophaga foetida TaxID=35839 RepID=UPI0005BC7E2A|nr:HPP family protein [Holophaga foetida]
MRQRLAQFPGKLKGAPPPRRGQASRRFALWGLLSGTLAILAIQAVAGWWGQPLLIGSFGASAVMLFGAPDSPLAQPRNLIGGHLLSALVAIGLVATLGSHPWTAAIGVGLAIGLMHLTHTTHPPGGATALIGVQGHATWGFLLVPVLAGVAILLIMALITNNIVYHRRYPRHWT